MAQEEENIPDDFQQKPVVKHYQILEENAKSGTNIKDDEKIKALQLQIDEHLKSVKENSINLLT